MSHCFPPPNVLDPPRRTGHSVITLLALVLLLGTPHGVPGDAQPPPEVAEQIVTGRLRLPQGDGPRGVELRVTVVEDELTPQTTWLRFDAEGRFSHRFEGRLARVTVTAGSAATVFQLDGSAIPEPGPAGTVALGEIDLRDRLKLHRFVLRAVPGAPAGDVRVAMWPTLPPVGPYGEPVSLGSAQFPPVALGTTMEWLMPRDAETLYFLVERPDGPGRGRAWRSGRQTLLGPFTSSSVPGKLVVD